MTRLPRQGRALSPRRKLYPATKREISRRAGREEGRILLDPSLRNTYGEGFTAAHPALFDRFRLHRHGGITSLLEIQILLDAVVARTAILVISRSDFDALSLLSDPEVIETLAMKLNSYSVDLISFVTARELF